MSTQTTASLDDLRKAAKRLKKAYANGETDALARVSAQISADKPLKHADFLHVIAKEAGQKSWPQLKFALESAAMSFEQRADRLKVALYEGQHWMTDRLLKDDPSLAHANFGLQVALYDLEAVRQTLKSNPDAAIRMVGVRSPILHLAFSKEIHRIPPKHNDMLEIARLLVAHDASVDDGYPATPGEDHKLSALYGALCHADNFELGSWLLENGANPNDNESLYHSTELGHTRALKSLLKHGAKPDGTNALPRALDFNDLEKVRLLLEAGADPNNTVPDHPSGQPMNTIPALHQAARRGRSADFIELLLEFGANPEAVWQGHTAYALARMFGNREAATALEKRGHAAKLTSNKQILADCADGFPNSARLEIQTLGQEDRRLLTRLAAEPGQLPHIKALIAAGLDPNDMDEMDLSPMQIAGWNGLVDEFRFFLSLKPDLTHKNKFGGDALDTVLHGSSFAPKRTEADHIECARLLLEAGSLIYPQFISHCGNEDMVAFLEDWIAAHPESLPA
ncbi:ankyrin repeat domain-containing protein [Labrenzia sp. PHM005]|uniref:ankyrin repeat domain-containing protein n=1 Tax=Labrenzia sp. PHM005 TaxID=2590016 RepID=UPI00114051E4|nr:ankyrin repeat domain-containing protein [Labrenzia sp. PHM005]QDG78985.1 ankyrin repeat domain-containing protein [Labrenzia sp. PHM005]